MPKYIAVIHKDADSDFGVSFPDFPGCVTAGGTVDEAKDLASEALTLHIQGMLEDGETIPQPARFEQVLDLPDFEDALAFFVVGVSLDKLKRKTARINITVPRDTLDRIDAYAKRRAMSRSAFLVRAAEKAIEGNMDGN